MIACSRNCIQIWIEWQMQVLNLCKALATVERLAPSRTPCMPVMSVLETWGPTMSVSRLHWNDR